MTILLRRNDQKDAHFSHTSGIEKGEIVSLTGLDSHFIKPMPATVFIKRALKNKDNFTYHADLNCFDYVRTTK